VAMRTTGRVGGFENPISGNPKEIGKRGAVV